MRRRINLNDGFIEFNNFDEYKDYLKRNLWATLLFLVGVFAFVFLFVFISDKKSLSKSKQEGKVDKTEIKNETGTKNKNKMVDKIIVEESTSLEENRTIEDSYENVNPAKINVSLVEFQNNMEAQSDMDNSPANMLDDDPSTAWFVNLDQANFGFDELYGPTFTLQCKKLSHIVIRNGYAKSKKTYKNNARALRIIICKADKGIDEYKQDSYLFDGVLKDTPDKQTLMIDPNISCNNEITKVRILFPLDGLQDGKKYRDLCISDIEFWGY